MNRVTLPAGSVTVATSPLRKYTTRWRTPPGVVTVVGRPAGAKPPSAAATVVPSVNVVTVVRPNGSVAETRFPAAS
ncbi:hypothetical protein GCM10009558_052490 [Virgisporangium aurantiacum]